MEKFEFYGAPDLEQEMAEARKPQPSGAEKLWKKLRAERSKGKLRPGEKMVFGKKVKTESVTANLRAELDEGMRLMRRKPSASEKLRAKRSGGSLQPGEKMVFGKKVKTGSGSGVEPVSRPGKRLTMSAENLRAELAELYPHLVE